ncbi:MAG TPA: hypothetical protein DCO77_05615 [Nitrospiraceae bacterium]|nr:hypothetical protein [Nitrospiraceae bacterium]
MNTLNSADLSQAVMARITPFFEEVLKDHAGSVHSIHVVGSAVTPDFNAKKSDINSVVVLKEMDLKFVEFLAPLGKKFSKNGLSAPLIMTPDYLRTSVDVFPIEFLDFKLLHRTVFGDDIFGFITIDKPHLRLQCEREIKTKLIGLRQGYLSTYGKKSYLTPVLAKFITGSMALFRAIITLFDQDPPAKRLDVVKTLGSATGTETEIFEKLLLLKNEELKPSEDELHRMFEDCYQAIEAIGIIIDSHQSS